MGWFFLFSAYFGRDSFTICNLNRFIALLTSLIARR